MHVRFFVKDIAKAWLNSFSTDLLLHKSLTKFFPMSKINTLKREKNNFYQINGEQFYKCWERFNDLLFKCSHHGFEKWRLVQYFYNSLNMSNLYIVKFINDGKLWNLYKGATWDFLNSLSENSQQLDFSNQREKSN